MISIIIPVYGVESYLDRCVQSVVNQTFRNLEILLVDDGSPDNCGAMCDRWAESDSRIHVIHQQNGGLSAARNAGIDRASGDWLIFVDADDYIVPDMVEKLHAAIVRSDAEVALCNFEYDFPNGAQEQLPDWMKPENYRFREECLMTGRELLTAMNSDLYSTCVVAWNKLYRRDLFAGLRYSVGRHHEDEIILYPLMYSVKRVVCIPDVCYHYVQRSDSIMGGGFRYYDVLRMLIDRSCFCLDRDERELALQAQAALAGRLEEGKESLSSAQLREICLQRWHISCRMLAKGWISPRLFLRHTLRCLIG